MHRVLEATGSLHETGDFSFVVIYFNGRVEASQLMIPSVFISSTIADLRYLRDALRDAVEELSYLPVMSEYGEITYISPGQAADACFRSVSRCQLVILIIGRRYGAVVDGLGVTHKEFQAAKDSNIPMFAFVEGQVLSFKEVYDADPTAALWNTFSTMDNPKMTFRLIDEVRDSPSFNGLIPFSTAGEAKKILKLQIADFVGQRLAEMIQPVRNELQQLVAEVRTLRNEVAHSGVTTPEKILAGNRYLKTTRFLLDDRHANLRKLVQEIAGELELGIQTLMDSDDFETFVTNFGGRVEYVETQTAFEEMLNAERESPGSTWNVKTAHYGGNRWCAVFNDNRVVIDRAQMQQLNAEVKSLQISLNT